jgi:AmiR/NasT family two-component response regulator
VPTRVVIAEDEAIIRLDLKETLEEEGYEVVAETGRGDEAVELVREHRPDVTILDIKMPGLDGLSAAREIAGERWSAVLILTAFSQRDLIERARDAGALAYLVKPFQKSDLFPAIEVALGRFKELKALHDQATSLEEQLETRKVVDRAKGQLMDRSGLSEAEAFAFIQKTAMRERSDHARHRPAGARRRPRTGLTRTGRNPIPGSQRSTVVCVATPLGTGSGRVPRVCHPGGTMRFMLIDGNSLTYRAFHALPTDLVTASGQVTNAQTFLRVHVDVHQPGARPPRPTPWRWRSTARSPPSATSANPSTRPTARRRPTSCASRWPGSPGGRHAGRHRHRPGRHRGRRHHRHPRHPGPERGDEVIIVTGDRDAYQLVEDPHVKVLYNKRGVSDYALYDEAGILERTGVHPRDYVQYAALRGDPRQPARRARRGREDRRQADQHLRRARRHLRPRRRPDPQAAPEPGRARGPGPAQRRA